MKTETEKATERPWIVDDRHVHPANGHLTYRSQEPETDVIVMVDTDCHPNGLLNEIDKANLRLIVHAVNNYDALISALELAEATIERLDGRAKARSAQGTLDVIRAALAKAVKP